MKAPFDLAILGGGAGGLLLLWHRLRLPDPPKRILWLDDRGAFGRGPAYSTVWPQHLLNVPAARMGALPDAPGHFLEWLNGAEGQAAAMAQGLPTLWQPGDFAPRLLYGAYLDMFRHDLEQRARALGVDLRMEVDTVERIEAVPKGYRLQGSRAWITGALALASGNRPHAPWGAPMLGGQPHPGWLGRMWDWSAAPPRPLPLTDAALPAVILGSGLTAVDAVLQLRAQGWQGHIRMLSRHARLPAAHAETPSAPVGLPDWPAPGARLSAYLRAFRLYQRRLPDWRAGIDALRPVTPALWQRLSPEDQRRFWFRLGGVWNIHRHRMAPTIAAQLRREEAEGQLTFTPFSIRDLRAAEDGIDVLGENGAAVRGALVVDCTGPSYELRRHPGAVAPLLEAGLLRLAPNGLGLAMNEAGLAHDRPGRRIVALGALAMGLRLESVAMPELRLQAALAAQALASPLQR